MCFVTLLHYNIQLSLASALASTYHSYKQTLGPFQHIHCPLYSPTQIAACHRHLYLAQARPHDAVSICLVGASLSEPHTYVKYATAVCMCIRECGSTLYVGMAQGVSLSLYIGIGAKFENTQKTGERRLRTAEYRTVLLETDLKGKRTYPAEK